MVGSTFTCVSGVRSTSSPRPSAPAAGIGALGPTNPHAPQSAWRQGRIALVTVVVFVAAALILAGVLLVRSLASNGGGPGNLPIGGQPPFVLGSPRQATSAEAPTSCAAASGISDWCYDVQVGTANDGITAAALTFWIRDPNGSAVNFTHGMPSIQLESESGMSIATYSFITGTWTTGVAVPLATGQTIVLDTGCTVSGADLCHPDPTGLSLVVLEVGAFSGQVQVTLD
jgi:hypothetical protein